METRLSLRSGAAWALFIALAFGVGVLIRQVLPTAANEISRAQPYRTGDEYLLVLVGASFCGAAKDPEFPELFERVRHRVETEATSKGIALSTIGVAIDWTTDDGLAFLHRIGQFDEVIIGRNWRNSGVDKFIRAAMADEALPEMLLVRRHVDQGEHNTAVSAERIVNAWEGTESVRQWLASAGAVERFERRFHFEATQF